LIDGLAIINLLRRPLGCSPYPVGPGSQPSVGKLPSYFSLVVVQTTHADYRIWQDGYRPITRAGQAYLKLTVIDDLLVVSFKELDP